MSNISRYADQVLHEVRDFLYVVKENGGLVSAKLREEKRQQYQSESGQGRSIDIVNIALQAMGKKAVYVQQSNATPQQIASLVERAKNDSRDILAEIKALREQKEKEKMNNNTTPSTQEQDAPHPLRLVDVAGDLTGEEEIEFQEWFEGLGITTKPYSPFDE